MDAQVLVVGAGPVGLMAAVELRRREVDVLVVERRDRRAPWAKAVGVQPRTLELWDSIGLARDALDASVAMRGQIAYINGQQTMQIDLALPDEVPYRFVALPQYETERLLEEHLARLGTVVNRGCELMAFSQSGDGVTATLREGDDERTVSAQYMVGCDGAHSVVRKGLALSFEGDAFPEEYMLADVEVDWDMPHGYGIRAMHQTDGVTDDGLVCIPLPGHNRYRMSMLVPEELATPEVAPGEVAHGVEGGRAPELHHIQAVLDRLSPQPTTARNMRWSSVFRISHRLVDSYSKGRVFVAGDAAHIHPPTGAQGMNTGVQDAYNLGWKLALAVQGLASQGLLDSYNAERYPVGEEVVGRTVRDAREGIGAGETSMEAVMLREAQLLVSYPDSPLVEDDVNGAMTSGPQPGARAPDAAGLRQDSVSYSIRWHELLRHPNYTLLLWAQDETRWATARDLADEVARRTRDLVRCHIVAAASATVGERSGITLQDARGNLAAAYGLGSPSGADPPAYLIRPDGYVGYRTSGLDLERLVRHLARSVVVEPAN